MIRQLGIGLGGVALCGPGLMAFAVSASVFVLMAGLVLAVAGGSAMTYAVGLR